MKDYPKIIIVMLIAISAFALIVCMVKAIPESSSSSEPVAEVSPTEAPAQLITVTAYCPCGICCGRFSDGITASGVRAVGRICAAPP